MTNEELLNKNIDDLKIGIELAEQVENDILKEYSENRINVINQNRKDYEYVSFSTLLDSYIIDIALFINISNIVSDRENKDYFKGRLNDMIKLFPDLKTRKDIITLL